VNHAAFDTFFSLTTNEEDKKQVKMLLSDSKKLHKGKKIHNFHIVDYNRTERSIKSLIKGKNSVVYFWNPNYVSKDFIAARINFLTREYPDINFIGVQIDGNGKDRIKKIDIKSQYYINEKSGSYEFLTSKMPRTLLINKKGIVTNGYASLSSRNIYDQIAQLGEK
jgi:peroxiredoxin